MTVPAAAASISPQEIAQFEALAASWWDPLGPFKPLHRINPVRIGYVRDRLVRALGRDPTGLEVLDGVRLLDVGCGGGLLAEPLARLQAQVTAIDAGPENIAVAKLHAERQGLAIDYQATAAEDLAQTGVQFDAVLAMEIVEHVADLDSFFAALGRLVKPGGLLFLATLNRTVKSYGLGIIAAEYVLGWVPKGTHDWRKFLKPSELARLVRRAGLTVEDLTGVSFDPLTGDWRQSRDTDVNYLMTARRPQSAA